MTQFKCFWTTVYLFTMQLLLHSIEINGSGQSLTIIPSSADFLKNVIGTLHRPNRKISINDRIHVEEYISNDGSHNSHAEELSKQPINLNIQNSQIVRPVLGASDNNHGESSISQVQYLNNDYSDSPSKIVSHETPQSSGYVPSNSLMQTLIDGLTGESSVQPDGQHNGYNYLFYPLDNKEIHQLQNSNNNNFQQYQYSNIVPQQYGNNHIILQHQQQQQQQLQQHQLQQHQLQQQLQYLQPQQQQLQLYYGNNNHLQPYPYGSIKPVTEVVHDTATDLEPVNAETQLTKHKVEPLFVAMAGFVGVAVVFLSALILIPRFPVPILDVHKGVLKQAPEELASLTKLVAESIDGKDCTERITCEVGRAMRSLQVGNKPIRMMEIILPPAIAKQLAQVRRSASKKEQCHFIMCKRTEGTLKMVAKLKRPNKTIHDVKEIFNL